MQRGLAPILIILILTGAIAVAGGGYYLGTKRSETLLAPFAAPSQTPQPTSSTDETADWKTYTSRFDFEFKYPENWSLKESDFIPEENSYITTITSPRYEQSDFAQVFNITISKVQNLEVYGEDRIKKSKQEKINSYQVIRIGPIPKYLNEIIAFKMKDNQYFIIAFDPYSEEQSSLYPNQADAHQIFNQILSTFKFLK